MNNTYKTIDEMIEHLNNPTGWWDKFILNPKMNWLRYIIYNLPDLPMDIYRDIKWFIQRGKRGYADCDVWAFDEYLSKIIINGVKDLKFQMHGVPADQFFSSKDGNDINMGAWKLILDEIIWAFEVTQKIINAEWVYLNSKKRNKKSTSKFSKEFKYHIMTREECLRYRNGWRLFQKYYFKLWD
jgi:hypothetical protein